MFGDLDFSMKGFGVVSTKLNSLSYSDFLSIREFVGHLYRISLIFLSFFYSFILFLNKLTSDVFRIFFQFYCNFWLLFIKYDLIFFWVLFVL